MHHSMEGVAEYHMQSSTNENLKAQFLLDFRSSELQMLREREVSTPNDDHACLCSFWSSG